MREHKFTTYLLSMLHTHHIHPHTDSLTGKRTTYYILPTGSRAAHRHAVQVRANLRENPCISQQGFELCCLPQRCASGDRSKRFAANRLLQPQHNLAPVGGREFPFRTWLMINRKRQCEGPVELSQETASQRNSRRARAANGRAQRLAARQGESGDRYLIPYPTEGENAHVTFLQFCVGVL